MKAEIEKDRQLETGYFCFQLSPFQLFFILLSTFRFDFPISALGFGPSGEKGTVAFKGLQGGGEQASGYECLRLFLVAHAAKFGLGLGPKESRIRRS